MEAARLLYDRKEAARQLSISVRGVDDIIAAEELDTRRIGRRVLVTLSLDTTVHAIWGYGFDSQREGWSFSTFRRTGQRMIELESC